MLEALAAGRTARSARALRSPWSRLGLLVALLLTGAIAVVVWQPHELLADTRLLQAGGATAVVLFGLVYGACTAAFVPRPLLNLASGALFGASAGLAAAVVGTVLGAGISFGLGRVLGQDAVRPLMRAKRGRWLASADRVLSRHAFRSMLAIRLFPGVPFAAANYCAAVSRMGWTPFLLATAVGCVPNTAAYVIAGSSASDPLSPAFFAALAFIVLTGGGGATFAWRRRKRGLEAPTADPVSLAATPGP